MDAVTYAEASDLAQGSLMKKGVGNAELKPKSTVYGGRGV